MGNLTSRDGSEGSATSVIQHDDLIPIRSNRGISQHNEIVHRIAEKETVPSLFDSECDSIVPTVFKWEHGNLI